MKDSRTGNYIGSNGNGNYIGSNGDSARGKGANGYNNGFGNPATMGQPLAGNVVNV